MLFIGHIKADSGDIKVVWSGGPYIDIYMGDDDVPCDTINVWDYVKDKPFVKRNGRDMCQYAERWLTRERGISDITGFYFETHEDDFDTERSPR